MFAHAWLPDFAILDGFSRIKSLVSPLRCLFFTCPVEPPNFHSLLGGLSSVASTSASIDEYYQCCWREELSRVYLEDMQEQMNTVSMTVLQWLIRHYIFMLVKDPPLPNVRSPGVMNASFMAAQAPPKPTKDKR